MARTAHHPSHLHQYLWLNGIAALSLGVSLLLAKIGFFYLSPVIGLIGFLMPGLNIAFGLWQAAQTRESLSTLGLWAIIFSFTITPVVSLLLTHLTFGSYVIDELSAFALLWIGSLVASLFPILWQGDSIEPKSFSSSKRNWPEILALLAAFLVIIGLNLVLYRYIPEGDSYTYLVSLRTATQSAATLVGAPQSAFLSLLDLLSRLMRVDAYWVLKIVFPLSSFVMVWSVYLLARPLIKQPLARIITALGLLAFPVILQELLIPRPQSAVLFCLVPAIYLVTQLTTPPTSARRLYWAAGLLVAGFCGLMIHFLFILPVLLALIAGLLIAWPAIKQRPVDAAAIIIVFLALSLTRLPIASVSGDTWQLLKLFANALGKGHFQLWFLSHYTNVDGNQAGWPGFSGALYYYLYNLGVFFPALLVGLVWQRVSPWRQVLNRRQWATILLASLFLFVAEIAPRFGLAFLPDRAWLLVAIAFALFAPSILALLLNGPRKRLALGLIWIAFIGSILGGCAVTYLKQGWVMPEEVEAARYIQTTLPANAVFLGQGSSRVFVRYFADRELYRPDDEVFLGDDPNGLQNYLADEQARYDATIATATINRQSIASQLVKLSHFFTRDASRSNQAPINTLDTLTERADSEYATQATVSQEYPTVNAPVYVIYSTNKFRTIYAQRSWWESSNFANANLDKLTARYPIIYNHDGVTIWKVK